MPPITNKASSSWLSPASTIKKRHSIANPGLDTPEPALAPRMDRRSSEGSPTNMTGLTQRSISRKREPYIASRTNPDVFLNAMAQVFPSMDVQRTPEVVVCRHLAYQFATAEGKKRDLMEKYRTIEGITTQFNGKLDSVQIAAEAAWTQADPACKHLVNAEDLGHYLEALANALGRVGQEEHSQVNCILVSAQHAMALHMSRKSKHGVEYFSAKFYDPNATASYKRVEMTAAEEFRKLTLESMMAHPELISACDWTPGATRPLVVLCLDPRLKIQVDRYRMQVSPTNMAMAMEMGSLDDVHHLLTEAGKKETVGSADASAGIETFTLADLFDAKGHDATPCLHLAMSWGHASTVKAFVGAVLASGLNDDKKTELLVGVDQQGVPGLNLAARKGHASTVKAFVAAILASDLIDDQKTKLLACTDSNGWTALGYAIASSCASTVKALLDAILASGLSNDKKTALLACKDAYDTPGLCFAAIRNHAGIVQAFMNAILASGLTASQKAELLACKEVRGIPALCFVAASGQASIAKGFVDAILASGLSGDKKAELLACEDTQAKPGLYFAATNGHAGTVKTLLDAIVALDLPEDRIAHLVSASGGLAEAVKYHHQSTVVIFMDVVTRSKLSPRLKKQLLAPAEAQSAASFSFLRR